VYSGINLQHLLFDKEISEGLEGTMELLGSMVNASIDLSSLFLLLKQYLFVVSGNLIKL